MDVSFYKSVCQCPETQVSVSNLGESAWMVFVSYNSFPGSCGKFLRGRRPVSVWQQQLSMNLKYFFGGRGGEVEANEMMVYFC